MHTCKLGYRFYVLGFRVWVHLLEEVMVAALDTVEF